jgi:hypothetical protein
MVFVLDAGRQRLLDIGGNGYREVNNFHGGEIL